MSTSPWIDSSRIAIRNSPTSATGPNSAARASWSRRSVGRHAVPRDLEGLEARAVEEGGRIEVGALVGEPPAAGTGEVDPEPAGREHAAHLRGEPGVVHREVEQLRDRAGHALRPERQVA